MTFIEFKIHVEAAGLVARKHWPGHWQIIDGALCPVVDVWENWDGKFHFAEAQGPHKTGTLAEVIATAGPRKTPDVFDENPFITT